jgi:hypothetical protein
LVEDLVVGWVREIQQLRPNTKSVLLVGDSTTAYCFDRMNEITARELAARVERRTGVYIWFTSVTGSSFTNSWWSAFVCQIEGVANWNYRFNAVLLVGGWNQVYDPEGFTPEIFAEFHTNAVQVLN